MNTPIVRQIEAIFGRESATQILGADILSFDIFDTAILRSYFSPIDIFKKAGEILQNSDFWKLRVAAEQKVREKAWSQRRDEISLAEIYTELGDEFAKFMQTEISLEIETVLDNPEIFAIYEWALSVGKQVVFVSDMYLPEAVMRKMLTKAGYDSKLPLYLSSTTGISKSSGKAFQYLRTKYANINLVHIGDNQIADYVMANRGGITGILYVDPKSRVKDTFQLDDELFSWLSAEENLWGSNLLARLAYWLSVDSKHSVSQYEKIAILFAATINFEYLNWSKQRLINLGIKHIAFLGRDSWNLHRIFEEHFKDPTLFTTYVPASRRAWVIPSETGTLVDDIFRDTTHVDVVNFLAEIGIADQLQNNQAKMNREEFSLFLEDHPEIYDHLHRESRIFYEFLSGTFFATQEEIGIIDIGWSGSIFGAISKFRIANNLSEPHGFYMATFKQAEKFTQLNGFLINEGNPGLFFDLIYKYIDLFELIYTAPSPQLSKYKSSSGSNFATFSNFQSIEYDRLLKSEEISVHTHKFSSHVSRQTLEISAEKCRSFVEIFLQSESRLLDSLMADTLISTSALNLNYRKSIYLNGLANRSNLIEKANSVLHQEGIVGLVKKTLMYIRRRI